MERLALRRRALSWLRAELAMWTRLVQQGDVGRRRLARVLTPWFRDPDLAGLRDAQALRALSTEERQACQRFWADVTALLGKAEGE
jgi:hypothetical protein